MVHGSWKCRDGGLLESSGAGWSHAVIECSLPPAALPLCLGLSPLGPSRAHPQGPGRYRRHAHLLLLPSLSLGGSLSFSLDTQVVGLCGDRKVHTAAQSKSNAEGWVSRAFRSDPCPGLGGPANTSVHLAEALQKAALR